MTDRTPPHNLEAEQSVLGAMMLSGEAREIVLHLLGASDFYRPAHGFVLDAIASLHVAGDPVDPVTVANRLEADGFLDAVGGKKALLQLQSSTPASANASHYARIIADLATLRRLVAVGGQIADLGYRLDVDDPLGAARALLAEVGAPASAGDETLTLDQVADRDMDLEWVVPRLYARGDRFVVVGTGGSGKSTVLRQNAVLCAQGIYPFPGGSDDWRIPPLRVLHVDCENPAFSSTLEYRQLRDQVRGVQGVEYDPDRLRVWERPDGLDLTRRSDVVRLASQIEHTAPDMVCVGPIYKMVAADLEEAVAVAQCVKVLDELRARFGFVLLIEGHVPHEGARPFGSSVWTWWPEYGRALVVKDKHKPDLYKLQRFRGDRHPTSLPTVLRRGGQWPWTAVEGAF